MMYDIILCEGETDAILISYYMRNIKQFIYVHNNLQTFPQLNNINKAIKWYKDTDEQYLAICPIGGSNFENAIEEITRYNRDIDEEMAFLRIALIMDYDDSSAEERIRNIGNLLNCGETLQCGCWVNFLCNNNFNETFQGDVVCILQPNDEYGALETFVLRMISQNDGEIESAVNQSRRFIQNFESERFLRRRREQIKAELSVSLSVISPDRTFTTINDFLLGVEWAEYRAFHTQFALLESF